ARNVIDATRAHAPMRADGDTEGQRMHETQIIPHIHQGGMLRREVLQVGMLGAFGLMLESAYRPRRAHAAAQSRTFGRAKSVVVVWMPGGPPQMHFWDPKPDSPEECR